MVTQPDSTAGSPEVWILSPTRSMSWPQAKRFLTAVAAVSLTIGAFFWALGLPLVLPFSGLEAAAVAWAFYVVIRAGERREVVRIEDECLIVERGTKRPEERLEFNRHWVRVELRAASKRLHPSRLLIGVHGRSIEVGRFLAEDERAALSRALINALDKNR
ncbi:MAG: DUF2244 domain-containing protein [Gammaproteobacteria bacterium]